jgi:uncharacterized LabA/DUF88 family protein
MPKDSTRLSSRADERVMVFIDGSNLYHVLGQMCGRHDLQFDKFAQKLADGRELRRVYYYNVRQEAFEDRSNAADQDKFLNSLYDTPYLEVKLGIWKQRGGTMVEKGVDVMLATDLVTRAYRDQYDTAIIVSGDADFYPALQAAKDVGKQVEVAAFDTNISAEAARVADIHIKLTKTFFTGLWMTRAQLKARTDSRRKPEVSDEAASPNGEDKAATKAASAARRQERPLRRQSSRRSPRRDEPREQAERPAEEPRQPAPVAASPAPEESRPQEAARPNIRRTPSRRKVGGTASPAVSDGANGSSSRPRPPALRNIGGQSGAGETNGGGESPAGAGAPAGVQG